MSTIESLAAGFARFRKKFYEGQNALYDQLRHSQSPAALVIACSDSRVEPAILLDTAPGQLFVVRNVANLVPPHAGDHGTHGVSAALEFAVCSLEVKDIIILGHSQCGGINALLNGAAGEYISRWMDVARDAAKDVVGQTSDSSPEVVTRACEHRSIVLSLRNLMSFPFVRSRVDGGDLTLHGWYFDMGRGEIDVYDPAQNKFCEFPKTVGQKG